MPIRPNTIKKYGEECIIVMDESQTLADVIAQLKEKGFQVNKTYLVVTRRDSTYDAVLLLDLRAVVSLIGGDLFTRPLGEQPIPPADKVVPVDIETSGKAVVDWVATHPGSKVVIVDGDQVVSLFANPYRSGEKGVAPDLLELHGEYINLRTDERAHYRPSIPPPICEHCKYQDYYLFVIEQRAYCCRNCKRVVKLL